MAAPLRYPLILLAWGAMAAIYLPLLPAAGELVGAARSPAHWRALFADPQLGQALAATLVSTLLSVGGALLIALTIVAALWPSARWRRLASRLPLLLAVPHLALATAALLLFAEGGWLWQQLPFLTPPVDRYGIGLGLTMALKESAFVLWVIYGLLGEKRLADQATALKSLGYGRWQCLRWLVLPALLPALGMVLLATTAWSLSAVDVALVLGPGNPPTLAVLAWQWLSQGDELQQAKGALASLLLMAILGGLALVAWGGWRLQRQYQPDLHGVRHPHPHALPGRLLAWQWLSQGDELQQAKGALASLLLMAILGGLALVAWGGWRLQRQYQPDLHGVRHPHPHALPGRLLAALLPLSGLLGALLLAGLARSAPPQMDALGNSLGLALAACALGAAVCLLWLACGPARGDGWVWLPLVLPALPLADGQYRLALYAWLDGDWWTVLWGHLLWVVPWMLFILRPAWRQRDPRLTVVARTLGWGSTRIFWLLTLPSLTRPLLTALAVGFSVSIAQYLPTLWLGAGRIPTLTSQAVALSSGGEAQTLAAQALWQLLLPAVCFTLTALLAWLAGRYRRGLR
ncbi:ABC transporter permease subunit [Klebsiella pneumoniae]|nr:ABC transporter permease subunit [Klebsiella pneumoniae]